MIFNGTIKKKEKGPIPYEEPVGNLVRGLSESGDVLFEEKIEETDGLFVNSSADLFISSDKSKLIIIFQCQYEKEGKTLPLWKVRVYDEDLNRVWSDSIYYEEVLGDRVEYSRCGFDYTPAGSLVVFLTKPDFRLKNIQASIDVAIYDRPGHVASKESKLVGYGSLGCKHTLIGETLYLCGITDKNLVSFIKKCSDAGNGSYKEFPLKDVYSVNRKEFPELRTELGQPVEVVPMADGVLYMSYYVVAESNSSLFALSRGISMIKFGLDGNLQWVKMIRKACNLPTHNAFFMVYPVDNDLAVFYGDNPANIISTKPGIEYSKSQWGLGIAVVSPDGTIKKTLLDTYRETRKYFYLSGMSRLDDKRFVIKAMQKIEGKENIFFRVFQF